MKTVIVDLCGTLILENTTHGFLKSLSFPCHTAWWIRLLQGRTGRIFNRIAGRDAAREWQVGALRGWSRTVLANKARTYACAAIDGKLSITLWSDLMKARGEGARIYLVTSSLQPIAEAVVDALSLDGYIASTLEFDSASRCTGRILTDVTGRKWQMICQLLPDVLSTEITVYTDNPEDTDLKQAATVFYYLGT